MLLWALAAFAQTLLYYAYLLADPGADNGAGAGGDQVAYLALAQQVLAGGWEGQMHYLPGYPAFLALAQVLFGDPRLGAAILQGLVYAGLVLGAWALAADAFGRSAGPWAAALVALNPSLGAYAGQALTEFLTGALLFATVVVVHRWSRSRSRWLLALAGALCAAMGYLRSDYLAVSGVLAVVVALAWWRSGGPLARAAQDAALVVLVAGALMAPWVVRYALVTGRPALYNESPVSDLILKGTWFRVFDERTFAQLQQIERSAPNSAEALAQAESVGPRPDLSARYMAQARGPYERPLAEALSLAAGNVALYPGQYLVTHLVQAPILLWGARTPVRQADVAAIPATVRWGWWGLQLALVGLAVWQGVRAARRPPTAVLGQLFLGVFLLLTAIHVVVAIDERFTIPALALVQTFAGARLAGLLRRARTAPVGRRAHRAHLGPGQR